jgi:hypothetical protein
MSQSAVGRTRRALTGRPAVPGPERGHRRGRRPLPPAPSARRSAAAITRAGAATRRSWS